MRSGFLKRHIENPIITPADMPFDCYAVYNAGATMFNGKVLLLLRVEDSEIRCNFYVATSEDGIHFDISKEPIKYPYRKFEQMYGSHRYDTRITKIEDIYYICHAIHNKFGATFGIAKTTDFVNFEPVGSTSLPFNRNAVLFPGKINGLYARLERPVDDKGRGYIWVSYSPDLIYWGNSMPIDVPRMLWNENKVGAGAPPIKTEHGWLEIYHGTQNTASTENYFLGVALLDLEDPSKIIGTPRKFILAAEEPYECMGQTPNVVFTSGAVEMQDGTLNVYYGGADTRVCVAQSTVQELVDYCLAHKEK
jgi:beta-1,4-mannooligosaccharide/beta-1,4-mannosyl-N-acetylglucosamine phosphorylase